MLLRPVSVLLVEGQEDGYLLIGHLLTQAFGGNLDLKWIDSYVAALDAVAAGGYDVCLVGYQLGERNGLDFIREAMERGCQIPMIFLADQDEQSRIKEALHTEAADFLVMGQTDSALLERSIRYAMSRKQLEQQPLESMQLISVGKVAMSVAHEINNPLTSILAYSQLMLAEDPPESMVADLQKNIQRGPTRREIDSRPPMVREKARDGEAGLGHPGTARTCSRTEVL